MMAPGVVHCRQGNNLIQVNGQPPEMIPQCTLQYKLLEPVLGSGHMAQISTILQSSGVQKYMDEASKQELRCLHPI
ncbi:unnamed protein product [Nyctereutes procyonoides]|uniref:(raccoon dog) hypothetical protein n=1 Tax=Nyctereutes procyonoides TaxID=34880 RepID=A0A811Z8M3_NYCPR|nr:unnamed protein product [Nyctereutes procyonoides]